jgi:hypothetical protein
MYLQYPAVLHTMQYVKGKLKEPGHEPSDTMHFENLKCTQYFVFVKEAGPGTEGLCVPPLPVSIPQCWSSHKAYENTF